MRRVVLACLLVVLASGCGGSGDERDSGVTMTPDQHFEPATITVTVGDEVTWSNASGEQHTVTADAASLPDGAAYFSSGGASTEDAAKDDLSAAFVGPGDSYSHTFDVAGTYRYYCIPHRAAGMTGTVVVEP